MDHARLLSVLKQEAYKINTIMRDDLRSIENLLLAEIIDYSLFNGGKRVRPFLCVLAAKLCGQGRENLYRLAIAFEYLHAATLLHDDVIDHADKRRGRKAANLIWGNTPAILAGDYLHARAMFLVGDVGGKECLEIICQATAAMVEGEFLQLHNARNFNQSEEDYFRVVRGKTAVLLTAVCEIGAVFANAGNRQREALRGYGMELGLAFQIVDDLLDYLGNPQKTGKAVGNDFVECKMTLPLIHALQKAEQAERMFLLNLLTGKQNERKSQIAAVCAMIEKYDGFEYARKRAEHFISSAIKRLADLASVPSGESKEILIGLASYVLNRDK